MTENKPIRILIIDDDPEITAALRTALLHHKEEVIIVKNEKEPFDCILGKNKEDKFKDKIHLDKLFEFSSENIIKNYKKMDLERIQSLIIPNEKTFNVNKKRMNKLDSRSKQYLKR